MLKEGEERDWAVRTMKWGEMRQMNYLEFVRKFVLSFFLGRMISIRSEEEKTAILSSLKNIPYKTRQEKITVLSGTALKLNIFSSLPVNDSSIFHKEIINVILDILESVANGLMNTGSTDKEKAQFQSQFWAADGYNTCPYLLSVYKDKKYKERIAIILGLFYYNMEIPSKGIIITDIFINSLKEYITEKQNK
jgi:hypothetical protein